MKHAVYEVDFRNETTVGVLSIAVPWWMPEWILRWFFSHVMVLYGQLGPKTSIADWGASDSGFLPPRRTRTLTGAN